MKKIKLTKTSKVKNKLNKQEIVKANKKKSKTKTELFIYWDFVCIRL